MLERHENTPRQSRPQASKLKYSGSGHYASHTRLLGTGCLPQSGDILTRDVRPVREVPVTPTDTFRREEVQRQPPGVGRLSALCISWISSSRFHIQQQAAPSSMRIGMTTIKTSQRHRSGKQAIPANTVGETELQQHAYSASPRFRRSKLTLRSSARRSRRRRRWRVPSTCSHSMCD